MPTGPASTQGSGAVDGRLARWSPGICVAVIWIATLAATLFSPDLITGSQQEHLPLVGILDWLWAAVATGYVVMANRGGVNVWAGDGIPSAALGLTAVWTTMALANIFAPPMVTGTDPTQIPLVAILVPLAAMAVTGFICLQAATSRRSPS
jgi:formate hydrogenlyase subunit 4